MSSMNSAARVLMTFCNLRGEGEKDLQVEHGDIQSQYAKIINIDYTQIKEQKQLKGIKALSEQECIGRPSFKCQIINVAE